MMNPLWGQQQPVDMSANPYPALSQQPVPQMHQLSQQGGGMFGGGKFGVGQAIVAALNGYLAGTRGPGQEAAMQNLQTMAAMRQRQMERQQTIDDYNRRRADENTDWQSHYDYELKNPKETGGSEYERLLAAAGIVPGTPQYQQHISAKVNELENPMVMTPYGPMPYSAVNPTGPKVGDIVDDPRKQGGPAPQTPGTFPY